MADGLFRKKSLSKVVSVDQLTSCIVVPDSGKWCFLLALCTLLIALVIWGVFGNLESMISVPVLSKNGQLYLCIPETEGKKLSSGSEFRIGGSFYAIKEKSGHVVRASTLLEDWQLHEAGLESDTWVFIATADGNLPLGMYKASIQMESRAPASLLWD